MGKPGVLIEKLAFGGNGICHINGKVCFVPFSCHGDEVRLTVTSEKRSFLSARISELVVPSPFRVSPPCPLFGRCGGCYWQHIEYVQQLSAKQLILSESLWRGARVERDRITPPLPSRLQYGYRSRVQFKLKAVANRLLIGFYRNGTHQVEDLPPGGCPVAMPVVNQALSSLRTVLDRYREKDALTNIKVECADHHVIAVITYAGRDRRAAERFLLERRADLLPLTGIFLQLPQSDSPQKIFGADELMYTLPSQVPGMPPCRLTYSPGGFAQVNRDQNAAMLDIVRRMGCFESEERVLDLFCGNGNFSLPIARQVGSVTGIEESKISVEAALRNSRLNGICNAEFICDEAVAATGRLADADRSFNTIILDPPRTGAAGAIPGICRMKPDKIIYVSCDPCTLARDCGILAAEGYFVEESVPVDMFPQTYHIESITLLQGDNRGEDMKFFKKLFARRPEEYLEKGDSLLVTKCHFEARAAFEEGLQYCGGKPEHGELAVLLSSRIDEANSGLAVLNIEEAEHAIVRGAFEKAVEHLELAITLACDKTVREKAESMLLKLTDKNIAAEALTPAPNNCVSCSHVSSTTQEIPSDGDSELSSLEYYELLIHQLPEQMHETYASFGEDFARMYISASSDNHLEALDMLEKWFDGSHRDIYLYEKGKILHRLAKVAEAENCLRDAIRVNNDNPLPHLALALLFIEDNRLEEAEKQLDTMIERDIFTVQSLMMRGEVYQLGGDSEAAINQFGALLDTPLGHAAAEKLYELLLDCGRKTEAEFVYKKYLGSKCKH